ncbi:hypothetical protein ACFLTD_01370 [Elusimicrobiota bacterium]
MSKFLPMIKINMAIMVFIKAIQYTLDSIPKIRIRINSTNNAVKQAPKLYIVYAVEKDLFDIMDFMYEEYKGRVNPINNAGNNRIAKQNSIPPRKYFAQTAE